MGPSLPFVWSNKSSFGEHKSLLSNSDSNLLNGSITEYWMISVFCILCRMPSSVKMVRSMKGHQMSVKTEGNWHPASRRAGGAGGHLLTILQIVPFDLLPQLYQSRLTALPQVSSMQSLSVPVLVPCAVLWRACLTHPASAHCHFKPNVKRL